MESKTFKITARNNSRIQLRIIPGHFVTPQSHVTHYLDLIPMKSRCSEAEQIAQAMAQDYVITTPIDTIVCMDGLEVVGAFLAEELTKAGVHSMNAHQTMYITAPELINGQAIFRDNLQFMIKDKNILILSGSITTGAALARMVDTVLYYGGKINGVSAIFSAVNSVAGLPVHSIFQQKDVPNYETYRPHECPLCKEQQKIDAMVNGFGYSKL